MTNPRTKLQGVQLRLPVERLPRIAYEARSGDGGLTVFCDAHLDLARRSYAAPLTGRSFPVERCEFCIETQKEGKNE